MNTKTIETTNLINYSRHELVKYIRELENEINQLKNPVVWTNEGEL